MAARLACPRIPPGGVGLAIRARMTRSASCRRRAGNTTGAIIQRPPSDGSGDTATPAGPGDHDRGDHRPDPGSKTPDEVHAWRVDPDPGRPYCPYQSPA